MKLLVRIPAHALILLALSERRIVGNEMGLYLLMLVHVHIRSVELLAGCQSSRLHGRCSVMRHRRRRSRTGPRGLGGVWELLHPAAWVIGRWHATATTVRAGELSAGWEAHSRIVVLRAEVAAAAALAIATSTVARSTVPDSLVVGRCLRISTGMRAPSHGERV